MYEADFDCGKKSCQLNMRMRVTVHLPNHWKPLLLTACHCRYFLGGRSHNLFSLFSVYLGKPFDVHAK